MTDGKKRANIQLSNETIHFQETLDKLHRNYDLFLKTNKVSAGSSKQSDEELTDKMSITGRNYVQIPDDKSMYDSQRKAAAGP